MFAYVCIVSADDAVNSYLQAVHERGGVLTNEITMASATAIVHCEGWNLLLEKGGSVDITAKISLSNPSWEPEVGEELQCRGESKCQRPYAVAVLKGSDVVGHLLRKFLRICSLFLKRAGTLICRLSGARRHLADLPQGGLEIPCVLVFSGDSSEIKKLAS